MSTNLPLLRAVRDGRAGVRVPASLLSWAGMDGWTSAVLGLASGLAWLAL